MPALMAARHAICRRCRALDNIALHYLICFHYAALPPLPPRRHADDAVAVREACACVIVQACSVVQACSIADYVCRRRLPPLLRSRCLFHAIDFTTLSFFAHYAGATERLCCLRQRYFAADTVNCCTLALSRRHLFSPPDDRREKSILRCRYFSHAAYVTTVLLLFASATCRCRRFAE